jgi:hypothetical protein
MRLCVSRALARALLVVMLATFLSPSFGWHMHADHHEIVHASVINHDHDDHDAHASIGHLLGHLVMHAQPPVIHISAAGAVFPTAELPLPPLLSGSSPPYRPPL